MKKLSRFFRPLVLLGFVALFSLAYADAPPTRPPVWMMPPGEHNGVQLQALFDHPDQWSETRSKIVGLGCADWVLGRISDDQLKGWAAALKSWNLKMSLEVGAVKEWGLTGQAAFTHDIAFWDKYIADGGTIDTIAMDEPLCCARFHIHKSDDYAAEETANFMQLARQKYPAMHIGDIEGYPGTNYDDLTNWITLLESKLQAKGVKGIEFFRLDVDWTHFIVDDHKGGWPGVKKLEMFCRARGIPFSLCYWAADLPALRNMGVANESTWYVSMMQMANDYKIVHGTPDEMVVESWVKAPSQVLPETGDWTFTRSVLDFCNTFVK